MFRGQVQQHIHIVFQLAGVVALGTWLYLLLGRGGFWRVHGSPAPAKPAAAPSVTVVIPARNEAAVVGRAVASLAAQTYSGAFYIVLVDDDSSDETAEAARGAATPELLTIVQAKALPPGWTGKLWAVSQGVREAEQRPSDYLLLTDADIVHPPSGLQELVTRAEGGGYDLVSWMVKLRCESLAERALIPAFVFFFFLLYPPAWIRSPRHATAGAAGGCMLIRREMLERIGGIARIRSELIDDCALARAVKQRGGRLWLGLGAETVSRREYADFAELGRMISRTAFTQLHYSLAALCAVTLGLLFAFLLPLALPPGGTLAWALLSVTWVPALRYYRQPMWQAPLLPLVSLFYLGATVHSAFAWYRGRGGAWKGRVFPSTL